MRRGLTRRMVLASALLTLIVSAGFAVLLLAITDLRESTQLRRETREGLVAAEALQKLVIDLETGVRGFVITREERFLDPWNDARVAFPIQANVLKRLVADDPVQLGRVRRITQSGTSYIRQALRGRSTSAALWAGDVRPRRASAAARPVTGCGRVRLLNAAGGGDPAA